MASTLKYEVAQKKIIFIQVLILIFSRHNIDKHLFLHEDTLFHFWENFYFQEQV